MKIRRKLRVRGAVQGVGFRPFVYRIAHEEALVGWVLNDAEGVLIEAEGSSEAVARFESRLRGGAPVHSRIDDVVVDAVDTVGGAGFHIRPSPAGSEGTAAILPDLATCPECLAEVLDASDRRYRYPFTNCTHCGPRFSIVERLPYDRDNTTMSRFAMCPACQAEYDDPADRRFHAQPNACPDCGPQLTLGELTGEAALSSAARLLRDGQIVAAKGLGGFHLLVNATDPNAVMRLRERKARARKPFAVMFADLGQFAEYCDATDAERRAVTSAAAPIVLVRAAGTLPDAIAPNNPLVGAMLPYSPLHHVLLSDLGFPLVATSANVSGEPICIDIDDARAVLKGVADAFLDHNRPIRRPVEDSVMRQYEDDMVVLRRGRGLAPSPVARCAVDGILGRGAQLKNALAVSRGGHVIAGPHIGDLTTDLRSLGAFLTAVTDFESLFQVDVTATDRHPDYLSRRGMTAVTEVQHHHAHAAACMAEHGLERVLAVVWDGTGFGDDGTIWGGEFLDARLSSFERVAHLRPFALPGGEAAILEPSRQAAALLWELGIEPSDPNLAGMLRAGLNCPRTTAAGRLFDAVSVLLGYAPEHVEFDGEAAIRLEHAAGDRVGTVLPTPVLNDTVVDWAPMVRAILESDEEPPELAAGFIDALARAIALVARRRNLEHVVLVGGCFQNRRLLERTAAEVRAVGLEPLWCRQIPPNDGGIAVGQVVIAASRDPVS